MSLRLDKRLRTLFWPRRRMLGETPGADYLAEGGLFGRRERIVPRCRAMYRQFDLESVPATRRADSLSLRLDAWRPLESVRYWIGWQGGTAHVWAWSDDDAAATQAADDTAIPESALHSPLNAGCRIVALIDGFEGQCWEHGRLRFSRWWADLPDDDQWRHFMRAAGRVPDSPPPEAEHRSWQMHPWARSTAPVGAWLQSNERQLVITAASVLALLFGWQLAGLWQVERALARQQDRMVALEQQAGPELDARERALDELERARELIALAPAVETLPLLQAVAEAAPEDTRIAAWQQFERQIELILAGEQPPPPEQTVRALEEIPWLEQVIAERGPNSGQLQVKAVLETDGTTP